MASAELAVAFDAATQAVIGPWYDATVHNGQLRLAEMGAAARGEPFAPEGPAAIAIAMALARAKSVDEDAARWFAELLSCLTTPEELFSRPGVLAREINARADQPPMPGLDRAELLALVA